MKCQCLTAQGLQCTRKGEKNSKFCKQHQKCDMVLVDAVTPSGKLTQMPMIVPFKKSSKWSNMINQVGRGDGDSDNEDDWEAIFDAEEAKEAKKAVEDDWEAAFDADEVKDEDELEGRASDKTPLKTVKAPQAMAVPTLPLPNTKKMTETQRIGLLQRNNTDKANALKVFLRNAKPTAIQNSSMTLSKILGDLSGWRRAYQTCRNMNEIMENVSAYELNPSLERKAVKHVKDTFKTCKTEQDSVIDAFDTVIKNIKDSFADRYQNLDQNTRNKFVELSKKLSDLWGEFNAKSNYHDVAKKLRAIYNEFLSY